MKGNVLVPVGPIREVVLEWMEKNEVNQLALAEQLGITERVFSRIAEQTNVTFEMADLLITKTVGPMQWMTDERLHEIYMNADLHRLDLIDPLDNEAAKSWADGQILWAWENSQTRGEAGKKLRMSTASFSRLLDPVLQRAGRGRNKARSGKKPRTHCIKGHEIAVVGRMKDGSCMACRQEYNERRRKGKRELNHGTPAGYRHCRQRKEGSCQPCKEAWSSYILEFTKRKKEKAV